MAGKLLQTEVCRLFFQPRRHHIPAGPAIAEEIQRGKVARQVIGFVIGGRRGGHQADMLRHRGEGGEQRQGFKPGVGIVGQAAGHRIPHRDMVGDKDSVEGRRFGLARQTGVIVEGKYFRFWCVRVTPGETVIPLRVIKNRFRIMCRVDIAWTRG